MFGIMHTGFIFYLLLYYNIVLMEVKPKIFFRDSRKLARNCEYFLGPGSVNKLNTVLLFQVDSAYVGRHVTESFLLNSSKRNITFSRRE